MSDQTRLERLKARLKEIPDRPGVYLHKNADGEVIYVGKARNLRNRVNAYLVGKGVRDPKTFALMEAIGLKVTLAPNIGRVNAYLAGTDDERLQTFNQFLRSDAYDGFMLIIDADRFGLSQLHQLRGRVGRGARKSYCILVHGEKSSLDSIDRLRLFEATRDGFEVAERDLQLRGPGEFLGTRQSGVPRFRFGNIVRDHELMDRARDLAIEIVDREGAVRAEQIAMEIAGGALSVADRD